MFATFAEFFVALREGRFGFGPFWQVMTDLYYSITQNPDVSVIWNGLMGILKPIYGVVPYILIILSLMVAFFGKKMMPVLKFVAFFLAGFVGGVYFITPLISRLIAVPGWLCGLVIAIVCAVLYRFLYLGLYAVAVVFSVYVLCYNGFYINPTVEYSVSKAFVCLAISCCAAIFAFILIKYLEMLGTAALGAYFVALVMRGFLFDYRQMGFLQATPWAGTLAIVLILGVPGLVVQFRTRRRY